MTPAQILAIKQAIAADPVMAAASPSDDGSDLIAQLFNAQATPTFYVWRSSTPASDVCNAIVWAALTPADAPDSTQGYANRALQCQAKQINVQTLVQGRDIIYSGKPNIRSGLQDALTGIYSGVAGASVGAGWNAVKAAMRRPATVLEKLLTTGVGTDATPSDLVFEGNIGYAEISAIRSAP